MNVQGTRLRRMIAAGAVATLAVIVLTPANTQASQLNATAVASTPVGSAAPASAITQPDVINPASHKCSSRPGIPSRSGGHVKVTGTVAGSCHQYAGLWIGRSLPGTGSWLWFPTGVTIAPGQTKTGYLPCRSGTWNYQGAFEYNDNGHWTLGAVTTITC